MSSFHHYKLAHRKIDSPTCRDRRLMIFMITIAFFLLSWAVGLLLSFCVLSIGLLPAENKASAVSVWTIENAINGLVIVGSLGLVYSIFIDGAVVMFLINPNMVLNMNSLYLYVLGTVLILMGLVRIVEAIQSCISSFAFTDINDSEQIVVDVRDLDIL